MIDPVPGAETPPDKRAMLATAGGVFGVANVAAGGAVCRDTRGAGAAAAGAAAPTDGADGGAAAGGG